MTLDLLDLITMFGVIVTCAVVLRLTDYKKRWPRWYWYFWFAFCGLLTVSLSKNLATAM